MSGLARFVWGIRARHPLVLFAWRAHCDDPTLHAKLLSKPRAPAVASLGEMGRGFAQSPRAEDLILPTRRLLRYGGRWLSNSAFAGAADLREPVGLQPKAGSDVDLKGAPAICDSWRFTRAHALWLCFFVSSLF